MTRMTVSSVLSWLPHQQVKLTLSPPVTVWSCGRTGKGRVWPLHCWGNVTRRISKDCVYSWNSERLFPAPTSYKTTCLYGVYIQHAMLPRSCRQTSKLAFSCEHHLPWGLKNPVIQNTLGLPSNIHVENWAFLSRSSVNQKPRVEESQDTLFQS